MDEMDQEDQKELEELARGAVESGVTPDKMRAVSDQVFGDVAKRAAGQPHKDPAAPAVPPRNTTPRQAEAETHAATTPAPRPEPRVERPVPPPSKPGPGEIGRAEFEKSLLEKVGKLVGPRRPPEKVPQADRPRPSMDVFEDTRHAIDRGGEGPRPSASPSPTNSRAETSARGGESPRPSTSPPPPPPPASRPGDIPPVPPSPAGAGRTPTSPVFLPPPLPPRPPTTHTGPSPSGPSHGAKGTNPFDDLCRAAERATTNLNKFAFEVLGASLILAGKTQSKQTNQQNQQGQGNQQGNNQGAANNQAAQPQQQQQGFFGRIKQKAKAFRSAVRKGAKRGTKIGGAVGGAIGGKRGRAIGGKVGGLGGAVGGAWGMAFKEVGKAAMFAAEAIPRMTQEALHTAEKYKEISGGMAQVFGEKEMRDLLRAQGHGNATAESAGALAKADSRRQDAQDRIQVVLENGMNNILTVMNEKLAPMVEKVADWIEALAKVFGVEFKAKAEDATGIGAIAGQMQHLQALVDQKHLDLMDVARDAMNRGRGGVAFPGGGGVFPRP